MTKKIVSISIISILLFNIAMAQVTIKITGVPRYYTPLFDTVFIAGSFNAWNAADPAFRMVKNTDGFYYVSVPGTPGATVEFKFTRGNWASVETQLDGTDISNRSFVFSDGDTISCMVENWKDMLGWHTSVGNTFIITNNFSFPQLNRLRRIWIYLPPDYFTSSNYYPVLYMHDGQNLFDVITSAYGEWGVDESMEALNATFPVKCIVVGIDNGGAERLNEYSPWNNASYGGGDGEAYTDFIVSTLKPFVDSNYRTYPDRLNTAIMGSSMGGLISFYAAIQRQDVFGKAGIFSPSFWFSDSVYSFIAAHGHQQAMKIYFLAGEQESAEMVPDMQNVYNTLQTNGFSTAEMNFVTKADGQHSEWFWKREFPDAFQWLFTDTASSIKDNSRNERNSDAQFMLDGEKICFESKQVRDIAIYASNGQLMAWYRDYYSNQVDISSLGQGIYLMTVNDGKKTGKYKFVVL